MRVDEAGAENLKLATMRDWDVEYIVDEYLTRAEIFDYGCPTTVFLSPRPIISALFMRWQNAAFALVAM